MQVVYRAFEENQNFRKQEQRHEADLLQVNSAKTVNHESDTATT